MSTKVGTGAFFLIVLVVGSARSFEPDLALPPIAPGAVLEEEAAKQPDKDKKLTQPPKIDIPAEPPLMGPQFPTAFNPHMMGDFPGTFVRRTITVFGAQTTTTTSVVRGPGGSPPLPPPTVTTTTTTTTPVSQTRTIVVPAFSASGFKIAENESPRPTDRVFFTYNYFSDLRGLSGEPNDSSVSAQTTTRNLRVGSTTTVTETIFPATPRVTSNLHREIFGFEKTFLDGFASIEVRVPLLQAQSNIDAYSSRSIGDLTIVGKYAFILDPGMGNVLSAGLAVTAPTGPNIVTVDGAFHSTLLQPWFGYIWNADRWFVQGFHSVVVPTDARDVTLLFNDVGLNFWLYRGSPDQPLRFIVPMVEAHVTTPLNHRDLNGAVFVPDLVVFTGGVHFGLFTNGTLSVGAATPVTGPRVFGVEAFMQLNWRF